MRKKIISCLLAFAMVFGMLQGAGVRAKADPGVMGDASTITVNASERGMELTDDAVGSRLMDTLNAMDMHGSDAVCGIQEYADYRVAFNREATADDYDFQICYDADLDKYTIYLGYKWNVNSYEVTLDCQEAVEDGYTGYTSITFCTCIGVYFWADFDGKTDVYYSKGIDGVSHTLAERYMPNEGEVPYYIPYGGKLTDCLDPGFVCFPEVTWEGKSYSSWYYEDLNNQTSTKADTNMTFTDSYNMFELKFEHVHTYPASTNAENDNVKWNWGTAENDYKDTSVTISCTDEGCTDSILIENTEDFPNSISIVKNVIDTTCTTDGKTIYTATAKYEENGTTYTYTDTKTVAGEKATGHKWEFDTSEANAVWNDDNTTVTIKKTCTDASHDTEEDGAVEVNVSSSKILHEDIPAEKCGEASKTVYTATFDSSVDPAIVDPFTITKTVEGAKLQHTWVFDTDEADVVWTGDDNSGYTNATITKTCTNTKHGDSENKTVNITVNVKREVKDNATHFVATFDSNADPDITTPIIFEKIVQGEVHLHDWKYETDNPELSLDDNDNYVLTIKKTCNSTAHSNPVTVSVSSKNVTVSTGPAIKCGEATSIIYTAIFNSEVDPDIPEAGEFTVKIIEAGPILQHNWVFETDPEKVTWVGSDTIDYTAAIIDKTCKNLEHGEDNEDYCTSVKIEKTIEPATKCGDASKIIYSST